MSEQQSTTGDRLEEVSRQLAETFINEGLDADMVRVQFLSDGLYEVRIAERGMPERESLSVSRAGGS